MPAQFPAFAALLFTVLSNACFAGDAKLQDLEAKYALLKEREALVSRLEVLHHRLDQLQAEKAKSQSAFDEATRRLQAAQKARERVIAYVEREKAVNEKLPELQTTDGKHYRDVIIRSVSDEGVAIRHSSGTARLEPKSLPATLRDRFGFDLVSLDQGEAPGTSSEAEDPTEDLASETEGEEPWKPSCLDDLASCSLFVEIQSWIDKDGLEKAGWGSAFLVNHGETTYIYSNVHNFHGAKRFRIYDQEGQEYDDIEAVEVAAGGEGYRAERHWGGDVIRMRLRGYRAKALTIRERALSPEEAQGRKIVVTGNTKGRGEITRLEGVISAVDENGIIRHTAATQGGNSGSPITDLETMEVLGVLTWGAYDDENPLFAVWKKAPVDARPSLASGSTLSGMQFGRCSFRQLYEERIWLNDLKKLARLMGLLDCLEPHKEGLFLNPHKIVQGDYCIEDITTESSGSASLKELIYLDRWLKSYADSNIGISNQDMLRRYIETYKRCLADIRRQRSKFGGSRSMTFYTQCLLEKTRTLDICLAYESSTQKSIDWFSAQRGSRGDALPLAKRYRMPSFSNGLSALGIGDEDD